MQFLSKIKHLFLSFFSCPCLHLDTGCSHASTDQSRQISHMSSQTRCHFNVIVELSHRINKCKLKTTNLSLNIVSFASCKCVCEGRKYVFVNVILYFSMTPLFFFTLFQPECPLSQCLSLFCCLLGSISSH